jgi:hypothetical protein
VVRRSGPGDTGVEEVELSGPVQPEGPGLTPFVATLPLSDGSGDSGFRIVEEVLARGLHWPVRMTYTRGALTLRSEVRSIASSP